MQSEGNCIQFASSDDQPRLPSKNSQAPVPEQSPKACRHNNILRSTHSLFIELDLIARPVLSTKMYFSVIFVHRAVEGGVLCAQGNMASNKTREKNTHDSSAGYCI